MRSARVLMLTAATLLLVSSGLMAAEPAGDEVRPIARASGAIERDAGGAEVVRVAITVDLTEISPEAVLAGYVVRVDFDPRQVELLGAVGGEGVFEAAPAVTSPGIANRDGFARLAAAQVREDAPAGPARVASALFRELRAGGAKSVRVTLLSAARAAAPGAPAASMDVPVVRERELTPEQ